MDLQSRRNSTRAASRDSTVKDASSAIFLLSLADGFAGGAFALTLTLTTDSDEPVVGHEVPAELDDAGRSRTKERPALLDRVGAGMIGEKGYSPAAGEASVGVDAMGNAGEGALETRPEC